MLHKAEEWKMVRSPAKIKLLKEHGRNLRLDDEAEEKLFVGCRKAGREWGLET